MSDVKEGSLEIDKLVKEYGVTTFVETGCFEGATLSYAQSLGLKLYSCDINSDYVTRCLAKIPEAKIMLGESFDFLMAFLPFIEEPTWFWLDGHYPNIYQRPKLFTMSNYFPLFEELSLIKQHKPNVKNDIIMCDDIGNIEAADNPLFTAGNLPPEAISAKGHLLQEYKDIFSETHNVSVLAQGCGLMIFLPKENSHV